MSNKNHDKFDDGLIRRNERFIFEYMRENAEYKSKMAANNEQVKKLRQYNRELKGRETA